MPEKPWADAKRDFESREDADYHFYEGSLSPEETRTARAEAKADHPELDEVLEDLLATYDYLLIVHRLTNLMRDTPHGKAFLAKQAQIASIAEREQKEREMQRQMEVRRREAEVRRREAEARLGGTPKGNRR